ncbi:MAG: hypothetical protein Q9204_000676 [Flavoplaca sp. TL-2023a]
MSTPVGELPPIPSTYTTTLLSVAIVFLALATLAVGVRIYSARISSGEDWITKDLLLIIAALVFCYGSIITTITGAAVVGLNYFGTRLGLEEAAQFTFKVKGSSRITSPISSAWHPDRQLRDANYDYPTALLAIFGIGIVLDFLVLCLPLRPISKLQLKLSKKLKIYSILWLGIFCAVCASVRFYYAHLQLQVVFMATAQEKATITTSSSLWSKLEPSASIIAACLPTYGPLFRNRTLGSIFKSAASFFSIRSKSRSSASDRSKSQKSEEYNGLHHRWYELHQRNYDHETKVEAGLGQNHGEADANYIRTTSEFEVAHLRRK